ncbi:site-2 protease family protein [[Clostridium] fimetarium]|uniref:Zn-dependent protease (Includes SpoIVFB) n=1 Tax=[Clostridium] fimetarium TaxID=99656 RepID=A0A1I0QUZ9_9FIRM|nr:site-2 protease family protein [[Clostridium] fimetarium]SEW30808.1 Zn-dependent protease (includes SpoIVFB) [[Clostridium] fimetarium]
MENNDEFKTPAPSFENRGYNEVVQSEGIPTVEIPPEAMKKKKKNKGIIGFFGAIFVIFTKFKSLIILLKLGKFASTFLSMFLMIWIYAQLYGFAFGVGFVVLLLIHEMGHYITAKLFHLDVSLPLFIPFAGAFINMKEMPENAEVEAKVGLGGPILGSIAAFICMLLYYPLKQDIWLALAYTGFMLNLFNLIPIRPLDGGRAVTAISPWLWLIGLPIAVVFLFKYFNPILLLILILGISEIIKQFKNPNKEYFKVKPLNRLLFAIVYFGLLATLGLGMVYIHGIHVNLFRS